MTMTLERKVAIRSEMRKLLNVVNANENLFIDLANRWLCEREYEDINDYRHVLAPILGAAGYAIVAMRKRPFGCEVTSPVGNLLLKIKSRSNSVTYVGG